MAFSLTGTRGQVRHRIHPKKAETRGPRGVVDKHGNQRSRKRVLDATRPFQFEHKRERQGVMERASAMVSRIFKRARGNR